MSENRTSISIPNSFKDKIVTEDNEEQVLFANGFGLVTDLQVGPSDGLLYVVAADRPSKIGAVYEIVPK